MDILSSVMSMKLDLYGQMDTQDPDTGAIKKEWNYIDTIYCSAKGLISNTISARSSDRQLLDNRYKNEQFIQIRTIEKLSMRHKIKNIRNKENKYIWTELDYPAETPTVFEIVGVTPITDPFGTIIGYNSTAKRSENQEIGI